MLTVHLCVWLETVFDSFKDQLMAVVSHCPIRVTNKEHIVHGIPLKPQPIDLSTTVQQSANV